MCSAALRPARPCSGNDVHARAAPIAWSDLCPVHTPRPGTHPTLQSRAHASSLSATPARRLIRTMAVVPPTLWNLTKRTEGFGRAGVICSDVCARLRRPLRPRPSRSTRPFNPLGGAALKATVSCSADRGDVAYLETPKSAAPTNRTASVNVRGCIVPAGGGWQGGAGCWVW